MAMDFSSLEGQETEVTQAPAVVGKSEKAKEDAKEVVKVFANKLQNDEGLKQSLFTASNSIRIVNTCGYGDASGLVAVSKGVKNAETGKIEGRKVAGTSAVVGYIIENVGSEAITFTTGVWTKNAEGIYEEQVIQDTINPGEKKPITRKYLAMLGCRSEFSFQFENGRLIGKGAVTKINSGESLDKVLSSYYFNFSDGAHTVHDDEVKVAIADKKEVNINGETTSRWECKAEYAPTFGFLDNPAKKAARTKAKKEKITGITQAAVANFLDELIKSNGLG